MRLPCLLPWKRPSNGLSTCTIITSYKKVYTTEHPSKGSNPGTRKNPTSLKKFLVIIRDLIRIEVKHQFPLSR